MFPTTSVIRDDERTLAWGAFALLFLLMVAHAMLETARDALFLSSIPPSQLPIVYLLVAGASLAVLGLQKLLRGRMPMRLSMSVYLVVAAVVTAVLWRALPTLGDPGLYILYVWSGVLITLILVEFWLTLGRALTVQQAKRLYAFVGTGSVAGAITGFAVAGALATRIDAATLLPMASVTLLVAAAVPPWLGRGSVAPSEPSADTRTDGAKLLLLPYVRKVAALVLIGTITVTVADYLFKASLATSVPAEKLAPWFAGTHLVLNLAALGVQLALTAPLIRRLGVTRSATVLPAALSVGALGTMLGLGLPAALALKGADGTLRHTLNHTARELLFLPLPERVRARVKGMIDVVGQRGGQALASVGILGVIAVGLDERVLGGLLLGLVAVWASVAVMLREPYLAVFRRTLDQLATGRRLDFPELDVASLESLIESLNSPDQGRVLAAMDILEAQGKARLVPALLLYHPSTDVVTSALALFIRSGRSDFIPIADQLQGNANPTVHAAVVRAKTVVAPDENYLQAMFRSPCRATRTTAAVYLHHLGATSEEDGAAALDDLRNHDNRIVAELAIARAAPHADAPLIRRILVELIDSADDEVAIEAVVAMGQLGAAEFLDVLVTKLASRALRNNILEVLPTLGTPALQYLDDALSGSLDDAVRREVPGALGHFPPTDSVPVLLGGLAGADGMVKYRIIRTLERLMEATPGLAESPEGWGIGSTGRRLIDEEIKRTLGRVHELVEQGWISSQGVESDPARATDAHHFLRRLLLDKQRHAEERIVRLIGLQHPTEDFGSIWRGLQGSDARVRASSLELLDHLLVGPLRRSIAVLFDDSTEAERLAALRDHPASAPADYDALLSALVESDSTSLAALAVAQVGELRLTQFESQLRRLPENDGVMGDVIGRTLAQLGDAPQPEMSP